MAISFLVNISEEEFRVFLKDALKELLGDSINPTHRDDQKPMNVEQAAEFLDLEVTTIYEKTSKREIPHSKKGGKLYFDRKELQEWIASGKVKTRQELSSEAATQSMTASKDRHRKA